MNRYQAHLSAATAIAVLFSAQCSPGQTWEPLNPGAGGQIQDLVLNPQTPNRGFVLSDVNGLFHTDTDGDRWEDASQGLASTNVLALAYDQTNPSRLYVGTTVGLHTSDDGGASWKLHPDTQRTNNLNLLTQTTPFGELAIGSVLVDVRNHQRVMAGVGDKRNSQIEQATVFRSIDGGNTFEPVRFGPISETNKSILQLGYNFSQRSVYAATAEAGLWIGRNFGETGRWRKLPNPPNTTERVEGVAIAPDGTVYAAFGRADAAGTALFASRTMGNSWVSLDGVGQPANTGYSFRNLVVDPRSNRSLQSVLTAPGKARDGLYEITISWNGSTPTPSWERVFYYNDRDSAAFEIGWEGGIFGNRPRPLAYRYTPNRWGGRNIWTTGDQTLFKVEKATKGSSTEWRNNWQSIYTSTPVSVFPNVFFNVAEKFNLGRLRDISTYRSLGWQSTVDMDVSRYGDVIVRSGADHGVMLSWDNGQSWEDVSAPRRAKSQSNAVVVQGEDVYLLAHYSNFDDFGARKTKGELWAAKIDPNNPTPTQWFFMAGGNGNNPFSPPLGLGVVPGGPNRNNAKVYTNIVPDPTVPGRVYISTETQGAYVIPNIGALYAARAAIYPELDSDPSLTTQFDFPRIDDSPNSNEYEGSMVLDPNDNKILYIADRGTLYRGVRNDNTGTNLLDRDWSWTPVLMSQSNLITFDAWDSNSTTGLAAATLSNGLWEVKLSTDGGTSWQTLLDINALTAARAPTFDFSEKNPRIFAVEGRGNKLYLTAQTLAPTNLGYGIFEVSLSGDSVASISDITGNLPFPKSFRTKVLTDPVTLETHLYVASWGGGSWRRSLD